MEGRHQAHNAAIAVACVELLREQGVAVPDSAVATALGKLQCAGRVEKVSLPDQTTAILDAAHNQDSIDALCRCIQQRFADEKIVVVFGTSEDKTPQPMLNSLAGVADEMILTQFRGNPRFLPASKLLPLVPDSWSDTVLTIQDPIKAAAAGLASAGPGGVMVVCGSFFLVAETRSWLRQRAAQISSA